MKKAIILQSMIAAIVAGALFMSAEIKAQNTSSELKDNIDSSETGLVFPYFFCGSCVNQNGVTTGNDISFNLPGIEVKNMKSMSINVATREFDALWVKGIILERKLEISLENDKIINRKVEYKADSIEKINNQLILLGNVKIVFNNAAENEQEDISSILADKIVINLE